MNSDKVFSQKKSLNERKKEIKNLIVDLKNQIRNLENEEININKTISDLKIVYTKDNLPDEIKNLGIKIPDTFHIYKYHHHINTRLVMYYVEYDDNLIYVNYDTFDPFIAINKLGDSMYRGGISTPPTYFSRIYQKNPLKKCFGTAPNTVEETISKAKEVMGDQWKDELAFGIVIFHYWYKIYYGYTYDFKINYDEKYKELKKMFQFNVNPNIE